MQILILWVFIRLISNSLTFKCRGSTGVVVIVLSAVDKFCVNSQFAFLKAASVIKWMHGQNFHINLAVKILTWALCYLFNSFYKLSVNWKKDFGLCQSENSYSRKKPTEFVT